MEFLQGFEVLLDWHVVALFIVYWLFMAWVSGMPEPTTTDSRNYRWAYNSLHVFAANLQKATDKRFGTETVVTTAQVKVTETTTTEKDTK